MNLNPAAPADMASEDMEKNVHNHFKGSPHDSDDGDHHNVVVGETRDLHRNLKGRHMQMIAMCVLPLLQRSKCCAQD